jgi:hypothetical protein
MRQQQANKQEKKTKKLYKKYKIPTTLYRFFDYEMEIFSSPVDVKSPL